MTEDEKEELILLLLMEFQSSIGATSDEQKYSFIAGARAALLVLDAREHPINNARTIPGPRQPQR